MAEPSLQAEAQRALAFGEQRFLAGDIAGAKQWAGYANYLAPGLPATGQALVAYDVHSAAADADDWHAVLCLPPPHHQQLDITHDVIKRQHRRLCLLVHPDKNPSAAADGAFKLVQAAYNALSSTTYLPPDRSWSWEEEPIRFWQDAPDDVTPPPEAPKQPPIARPTPCSSASPPPADPDADGVTPAPGHEQTPSPTAGSGHGHTALLEEAPPGSRSPPCRAAPTPAGTPERPPHGQSCPLLPYCLFCRSYEGGQRGDDFFLFPCMGFSFSNRDQWTTN
ncbi:hypothetical protein HU200_055336 [Digitaria exilis]|uniref:J domain-containing protein n=1 Tax=Digitaria exilis TaxID=1010633 RepID=A0A835AE91_9POAL|nr:hypothetical protein HU200_055336 [Digitaria exilis]CAB3452967.1 unnamed protein product [Digitaria exilis]